MHFSQSHDTFSTSSYTIIKMYAYYVRSKHSSCVRSQCVVSAWYIQDRTLKIIMPARTYVVYTCVCSQLAIARANTYHHFRVRLWLYTYIRMYVATSPQYNKPQIWLHTYIQKHLILSAVHMYSCPCTYVYLIIGAYIGLQMKRQQLW